MIIGAILANSLQQNVCDGCLFWVERAESVQYGQRAWNSNLRADRADHKTSYTKRGAERGNEGTVMEGIWKKSQIIWTHTMRVPEKECQIALGEESHDKGQEVLSRKKSWSWRLVATGKGCFSMPAMLVANHGAGRQGRRRRQAVVQHNVAASVAQDVQARICEQSKPCACR